MKLNKRSLIISIASLALGLAAFITFLVLFINSYEASGEYSYEKYDGTLMYESDFTFNQDYAIGIILGIVLISYGVYELYKVLKENKPTNNKIYHTNLIFEVVYILIKYSPYLFKKSQLFIYIKQ